MKKYFRKRRHLRYTNRYLNELRWDIINTVISSSQTGFHNGVDARLENLGLLIHKYERRRRLLRF